MMSLCGTHSALRLINSAAAVCLSSSKMFIKIVDPNHSIIKTNICLSQDVNLNVSQFSHLYFTLIIEGYLKKQKSECTLLKRFKAAAENE